MEPEEIIEQEIDWRTDYVMRLAKRLFQINLALSVVAAMIVAVALCAALFTLRPEALVTVPTLGAGLLCELFYYQQSRNGFLKRRVFGWGYSAFINVLCTAGFVACFFQDGTRIDPLLVLLALYPAFFLAISVYALVLIWKSGGIEQANESETISFDTDGAEHQL